MDEPNITLPLSEFLKILWGYKKHAELRNRAVPGEIVVEAIKQIPNYQDYVHIHEPTEPGCLQAVWQKSEWKESGERFYAEKEKHEKQNFNADKIAEAIGKKLPMMPKDFIRMMAHNICNSKDFKALEPFGITEQDLKL